MTLKGKVAIVTGGAQGIGKGIAQRFLREGLRVVIADIDAEAGREAVRESKSMGEVLFIRTDVAGEASVKKMVKGTLKRWKRIDILVNNAGVTNVMKPLGKMTMHDWNRVISVNLTGPFLCARHAASHLKKTKGSIINIASIRALMTEPDNEAYSASKGGVVSFTMALAMSLGPDVRVNCISPGWIDVREWRKKSRWKKSILSAQDHSQHPAGRVGTPEDIASAALFLASPESSFITGANLVIDGGMIKKMIYV
jgi:NAD(P)-dependent dehydrogenase (short-subunit alcohol dehydrogenase family)